jgi:hypothetical protein
VRIGAFAALLDDVPGSASFFSAKFKADKALKSCRRRSCKSQVPNA